jgi:hypothetical protein
MNDNELSTIVREAVSDVHTGTPVEQIVNRGRALRARRRIPLAAGALTAAVGAAALTVTALTPSGHPASPQPSVKLAAWTVAKRTDGNIYVTVRELRDPAGLQATLRADGVPVNVSFSGPPLSKYCQPYPTGKGVLGNVAQFDRRNGRATLVLRPSALPSGVGIALIDHPDLEAPPQAIGLFPLQIGLVQASPRCTGG